MIEGLRIYDLPPTAGPPGRGGSNAGWREPLVRAAAMQFNTVCLGANGAGGKGGDGAGRKARREFAAAARDCGLRVIVDLMPERAAADPAAAAKAARQETALGVGGFRCRRVDRVSPQFWQRLIADTKAEAPDAVFCADTLGLSETAVLGLAGTGFDYLFNSVKWWDFRGSWLLDQYERFRRIAPSIGFPEEGGERLVAELLAAGFAEAEVAARYRQAYAVAAAFSSGVMMPMGFEYGWSLPLGHIDTAGSDDSEPARFDLTPFIARVNRLKAAVPALNREGKQLLLSPSGDSLVALLRDSAHGAERALTLINTHAAEPRQVGIDQLLATAGIGHLGHLLALFEAVPDGGERAAPRHLALAPLEVRVLRAKMLSLRPVEIGRPAGVTRPPQHHPDWRPEARVVVENVAPEIDGGRFPVKRVVGDEMVVAADLLRDGHDRIAAVLRYAFEDEAWQETPLAFVENDRWVARFRPDRVGSWHYTILAWTDRFASWLEDFNKKREAGQETALELVEGEFLVRDALRRAGTADAAQLRQLLAEFDAAAPARRTALLQSEALGEVMARTDDRRDQVAGRVLELVVDRPEARFSAWYEMFPRSQGRLPGRSATFDDCIERLADVAALGFDVVYLVPIHPIGRQNRKGADNAVVAAPADPGSPYAIGAAEGGHRAVNPELGTLDDFRRFVAAAADLGIEVALDFAIQCAPDHPWVSEHKRWFEYRPDGSIKHAENPPKKYEDIVNVDFYNPDREGLWRELRDTVLFWVEQGVRIFRVDNPHTKPLPFWEWLIREVKARAPGAIFLSEAFTRPKMMRALAKLGFTQSYTYFTWRNTKWELTEYLNELTAGEGSDYFRPNFFTNTPDILPVFLQQGGRPAFRTRLVLAGTLSPSYGIYNGFELCENTAIPGREEYLHSEKYEYKVWDWDRPGNIKRDVEILNRFRRDNPALHELTNLVFLDCGDPNILAYAKAASDSDNIVIVLVNLDPFGLHAGEVVLPLADWGIAFDEDLVLEEAFSGQRFTWRGERHFVSLDPNDNPAMLLRLLPGERR